MSTLPVPAQRAESWPSRPDPSDAAAEMWAYVERARAGDAQAFGVIFERYHAKVLHFITWRVGHHQDAEDLAAETFARALKNIGSITWQGRDVGAWLITIAKNLVMDRFKSGRYRLEVATGEVFDLDRRDPGSGPEPAAVSSATAVVLAEAMRALTPEQRVVLQLRFEQGCSVEEVATALGRTVGAVKALQYRGTQMLARNSRVRALWGA